MTLELYINGEFKQRLKQQQIYMRGGFEKAIQYFKSLHGLKNKVWYVLVFNGHGRFDKIYLENDSHLPEYITVKSIFPEIIE